LCRTIDSATRPKIMIRIREREDGF
jgi:hypothetical protein